ncbi:hypothetical protein J6590_013398 [Homalodisca vitripennis]|nr:hypothetical protein J6590_013398 [Homalodisca vitripennis]
MTSHVALMFQVGGNPSKPDNREYTSTEEIVMAGVVSGIHCGLKLGTTDGRAGAELATLVVVDMTQNDYFMQTQIGPYRSHTIPLPVSPDYPCTMRHYVTLCHQPAA